MTAPTTWPQVQDADDAWRFLGLVDRFFTYVEAAAEDWRRRNTIAARLGLTPDQLEFLTGPPDLPREALERTIEMLQPPEEVAALLRLTWPARN